MFKQFYGIKKHPFKLTPDPEFLYQSSGYKKALLYLTYGLETKKGFIRLTGEAGSGKATIIRSLLKNLHKEAKVAYITNPELTFNVLLRTILFQFSITTPDSEESKDLLLGKFAQYLTNQARKGNPVVIIINEAQNMELPVLEEIRLLSNLETEKEKLLQIIFIGQPELRNVLSQPELRQLKQRISTSVHIKPLDRIETRQYINHRMTVAGANGSVAFKRKAYNKIYQYSKGLPRLINIACDTILLAGYVQKKKVFNGAMAKEAISELTTDGIKEVSVSVLSTKQSTSMVPETRKSRWKLALAFSLLFAAAIAVGATATFWKPFIHQRLESVTTVVKKSPSLMTAPNSDTNLLEIKD